MILLGWYSSTWTRRTAWATFTTTSSFWRRKSHATRIGRSSRLSETASTSSSSPTSPTRTSSWTSTSKKENEKPTSWQPNHSESHSISQRIYNNIETECHTKRFKTFSSTRFESGYGLKVVLQLTQLLNLNSSAGSLTPLNGSNGSWIELLIWRVAALEAQQHRLLEAPTRSRSTRPFWRKPSKLLPSEAF